MTKQCSVCNAQNRDEAQFCRACGSVFAAATGHGSFGDEPSVDNICSECGFRNKPDIRYCANCGMNLSGSTDIAPLGDLAPLSDDADPGSSPPPISYASFATVEPYPPAPAMPSGYPPSLDDTAPLDIPDPDARIAIRQQEADDASPPEFMQAAVPAAPNQAKRVVIVGVAALVVAAIAAWIFLGRESAAPPAAPVVPALAPVAVPAPAPIASAAAPIIIEMPAVAASAASAAVVESAPVAPPVVPEAVPVTPPTAAASLPKSTEPVPVANPADADAKRLAAEKARRDKAARDKAEREAKAKALAEQREQAAAAARAEQEAQARKRAEEAQRSRAVVAPPASAAASTQARGVRETCAGRGTIAEAVCQSRLCSAAEHANEPICRQIREADERRNNLLN